MRKWLKNANWLIIAGVVTVFYAAALLWQLGSANVLSFLSSQTSFNEIGDFLAGVFAPVALIWLVAAVFTQRQELNETREQFEDNRRVIDEQLTTIRSQNALLALQHDQARESAKQTYKLNLFNRRFETYNGLISIHDLLVQHGMSYTILNDFRRLADKSKFVFSFEIERYLDEIQNSMEGYLQLLDSVSVEGDYGETFIPQTAEYDDVRNDLARREQQISDALSVQSLRQTMWSALHVSDN